MERCPHPFRHSLLHNQEVNTLASLIPKMTLYLFAVTFCQGDAEKNCILVMYLTRLGLKFRRMGAASVIQLQVSAISLNSDVPLGSRSCTLSVVRLKRLI